MEELREFCESGLPITLDEEWEEFNDAKQLLLENEYKPDPDDPNTFIKVSPQVENLSASEEHRPLVHFPENEGKPEYLPVTGNRNKMARPGPSNSSPDITWVSCRLVQYDTARLSPQFQIVIPARIPMNPPLEKQQSVKIQVKVHPQLRHEPNNLLIHLQPQLLQIGVPKAEEFPAELSLGFYPCFTRFTLTPLFPDRATVALPVYTAPEGMTSNDLRDIRPAGAARKTTGTRLGGQLSGWGIISFTAERSWEIETEEEARQFEKLVPVTAEDGNAASFEWSILRWSEGDKYNTKKPHKGIRFKRPKPPFAGGSSTIMRQQRFPGALWHLDPAVVSSGSLRFSVHIEVEMHLVWFLGSYPFFKSPGSDSTAFEWRHQFEVSLS